MIYCLFLIILMSDNNLNIKVEEDDEHSNPNNVNINTNRLLEENEISLNKYNKYKRNISSCSSNVKKKKRQKFKGI